METPGCDVLVVGWSGILTIPVRGPDDSSSPVDEVLDAVFEASDRPEMVALLGELVSADVMVILATDSIVEAQEILATRYLDTGLATALVNTALVGVRPPDAAFYQLCLDVADVAAERILFVDRDPLWIAGADAAGMRTFLIEPTDDSAVADAIEAIRNTIASSPGRR